MLASTTSRRGDPVKHRRVAAFQVCVALAVIDPHARHKGHDSQQGLGELRAETERQIAEDVLELDD